MRVYVALPLPETFRAEMSVRLYALKKENSKYHWLDDHEFHVTTNFYGDLDAKGVRLVHSAVKLAAAGFGAFTMSVGSIGINWDLMNRSRHIHNTRVAAAWAALFVDKGKEEITALADKIDATLMEISKNASFSFRERIRRPFTPYITILRMGRPRETVQIRANGKLIGRRWFRPAPECLVREAAVYAAGKMPPGVTLSTRTLVSLR